MAQELITYGADRRLVLANGQAVRGLIYTDTWSVIRLGIRLSFIDVAASIGGTPQLVFGVCRGDAAVWAGGTSTHVVGARTNVATLTYDAGPPTTLAGASEMRIFKRVGSTITNGASAAITHRWASGETVRSGVFLQITKGTPFTFIIAGPTAIAGAQVDLNDADFNTIMELALLSGLTGIRADYSVWNSAQTVTVDEGVDGVLDYFFCFWDRTAQKFSFDMKHRKVS